MIGPNCLGTISFRGGFSCFAGLLPDPMIYGPFGAVSQSGSFCLGIMNATQHRGLGLSCLFSSGNEAVLEASDYIHYLVNDPGTKVIGAFIEGFKDPEKFLRVADLALEKEKPLIVLKVGRSRNAVTACRSHTGSMVGADNVQDAIFKQKNVIRVESIDEMVDTARMLIHRKPLSKGSASFVGLSGGICAYISDNMERLGVPLPEFSEEGRTKLKEILPDYAATNNPLDSTGQARIDLSISYRTIDTMVEEKTNDMFFYNLASFDDFSVENMRMIAEYVAREKADTPDKFVGIHMLNVESWRPEITEFYKKHPVPIIQGGFEPIRNYIRYLERLAAGKAAEETDATASECVTRTAACLNQCGSGTLCESVGHDIFTEYGIPSPEGRTCRSPEEALDFAKSVGFPVALKIDSAEISHKTDVGAVALNIRDASTLQSSFETVVGNCRKAFPAAKDLKVLVQKMAPEGIDVFLGMKMDDQFGPAIVLGMGGVLVEVLRDTSIRLAPIRRSEALEMIRELSGYRLFSGVPRETCRGRRGACRHHREGLPVREAPPGPPALPRHQPRPGVGEGKRGPCAGRPYRTSLTHRSTGAGGIGIESETGALKNNRNQPIREKEYGFQAYGRTPVDSPERQGILRQACVAHRRRNRQGSALSRRNDQDAGRTGLDGNSLSGGVRRCRRRQPQLHHRAGGTLPRLRFHRFHPGMPFLAGIVPDLQIRDRRAEAEIPGAALPGRHPGCFRTDGAGSGHGRRGRFDHRRPGRR